MSVLLRRTLQTDRTRLPRRYGCEARLCIVQRYRGTNCTTWLLRFQSWCLLFRSLDDRRLVSRQRLVAFPNDLHLASRAAGITPVGSNMPAALVIEHDLVALGEFPARPCDTVGALRPSFAKNGGYLVSRFA